VIFALRGTTTTGRVVQCDGRSSPGNTVRGVPASIEGIGPGWSSGTHGHMSCDTLFALAR
jgi:hypothetical protein